MLMGSISTLEFSINPLRWVIYETFYKHFCAGRNAKEVAATVSALRGFGITGVILNYAKEVDFNDIDDGPGSGAGQLEQWLDGTMRTVEYSVPGDFVALKLSGAGKAVTDLLKQTPSADLNGDLKAAIEQICQYAISRNVKLLVDAEHANMQLTIDKWTVQLMRAFNKGGQAVVYNTYQMYLKSAPSKLASHVQLAEQEGWALGVKLVRGAYLDRDPRHLICDNKAITDKQFNDAVTSLFARKTPVTALVIASHNRESIEHAIQTAKESEAKHGTTAIQEIVYAQLMGMADELSYWLTLHQPNAKVYKYIVWGSVSECVHYLLRRAEENKSSVGRAKSNVRACWTELKNRLGLVDD